MNIVEWLGVAALHRLDPEHAHDLSIKALQRGLVPLRGRAVTSDRLRVSLAGMTLPNPIGLAAGYDKNGRAVAPLMRAGFGFLEIGAATPRPQPGNPKPRLFRLTDQQAIINRFGFNNEGADVIGRRLAARPEGIPVGLNLGANKDSDDRAEDFATVLRKAGACADFVTVNVSSPNTERLRDLQGADALAALLDRVVSANDGLARRVPIFVKIAPDLSDNEIADIAAVVRAARVDAIIATNTTLSREGIRGPHATESGGLSGRPIFAPATRTLALLHRKTKGEVQLIGVGGISSPDDVWNKLRAGATAVQIYSAMIFQGLSVAPRLAEALDERLSRSRMILPELTGTGTGDWL